MEQSPSLRVNADTFLLMSFGTEHDVLKLAGKMLAGLRELSGEVLS